MNALRPDVRLVDPRLLGRHQGAAFAATCVDFGFMVSLVEAGGAAPAYATALGALAGGVTNFLLSRRWAYQARHSGSVASQGVRYAAVSLGGALLNAALVQVAVSSTPLPYVLARLVGAAVVSLVYTYPLHTRVVFRVRDGSCDEPDGLAPGGPR
jgi:putative flippase GtrA